MSDVSFNEANGLPPGVLGEEGRIGSVDYGVRSDSAWWKGFGVTARAHSDHVRVRQGAREDSAEPSAARISSERPVVQPDREGAVKTNRLLSFALWWAGLLLVLFGIIETWRGNGIGEMMNFILAGFVLRFFAHDLFE
jgi:hypothetical protein